MKNLINPVKLLFRSAASHASLPHTWIRFDDARTNLGPEISLVVIQPQVLQPVPHDALNVSARFFERNRLRPLVDLERQRDFPLHRSIWTSVVRRRHILDAAKLVDLIAQVSRPQLNIQTRLIKRLGGYLTT